MYVESRVGLCLLEEVKAFYDNGSTCVCVDTELGEFYNWCDITVAVQHIHRWMHIHEHQREIWMPS